MGCFIVNDTLVKVVSETLPSAQLIFLRGLFATVLLLAVAGATGAWRQLRLVRQRTVAWRSVVEALGTMTYLTALFHMPLGNATAINLAAPLFITVFAVIVLREHVTPLRWLAITTGFAGVLLVVQPTGAGFNAYAWLCVLGTLLHAVRDLMTRYVPAHIPSLVITVATTTGVCVLSGTLSLWQGWAPVDTLALARLLGASAFLATAYYLLIVAMRAGEMSVIAPFRYSGLLFALVLGFVVWGDIPDTLAWAGIALLVGAGLYMLASERARRRAALEAAPD